MIFWFTPKKTSHEFAKASDPPFMKPVKPMIRQFRPSATAMALLTNAAFRFRSISIAKAMVLATGLVCHAAAALGDELSDKAKTAYMFADYGLGTYKSLLVASNDTMGVITYAIGANAGQNKNLGVEYRVETQTASFALNQSQIATSWTSTIIKYRLWAFELGPVIGKSAVKASRAGTEILDVVSSGYGGYFGMMLPMGRNSLLYVNAMSVANSDTIDRKERTITMGSRTDLEIGSRIGITRKALDVTLGYRRRTNAISESGTGYTELQTATFIGFHTGMDF